VPRRHLQPFTASGYTFFFVVEDGTLHVNYRPGITPRRAINTFFDGCHRWNDEHMRYQGYTDSHGIYWTWLYGDETSTNVLIISCFPLDDE
jgi:hypothetical protein